MSAPLIGIRVLDLSRVLSGPYATMTLADLGADVVKVEEPGHGDDTRAFGPPYADGVSTYFLSINRGKRSLALDLKSAEGRRLVWELALVADVLVENFRPGVADRLGLSPDALHAVNPRLVYCSISGFGRGVPRPGYDLMVQGLSGIPSLSGEADGPPTKCGASIADLVAGMNAVQGILAALYRREHTGRGGLVDVPMLDGQRALLTYHASAALNAGTQPTRIGNAHPSIHPFCAYSAADGWLNLCVGNDSQWAAFCGVLARPEWVADPRFSTNRGRVENRVALDLLLGPLIAGRAVDSWLALLDAAGVPCGPVRTVVQALAEADTVTHDHPAGGTPVQTLPLPWSLDGAPRAAERRAPQLGEHGEEVVADWLPGRGLAAP
jgi:crotonobetainyl-CoA:carnitine CoA-transferase CaiB-like acyl-CoA transferase